MDQRSKTTSHLKTDTENFVSIVVPNLSTTSSSSSTSTPTTPSCQQIDHSDHHPAIETSESVDRQARGDPYTSETPEELSHEPTKIPKPNKKRITNRYEEARIPTYQNGCKNSERIWWMTESLNAETHTQVLLVKNLQNPERLGKHSVYAYFPNDRNYEICQRTKITRAPRRRRDGGSTRIRAKQKLLRKRRRACKSSWSRIGRKSQLH